MRLLDGSDPRLYLLDGDGRRPGGHVLLDTAAATGRLGQGGRRVTSLIGLGRGQVDDEYGAAVGVRVHLEYVRPDHRWLRHRVAHGLLLLLLLLRRRRQDGRLAGGGRRPDGRRRRRRLDDRVRRTTAARGRGHGRYFRHDDLRRRAVYVEHAP